MTRFREPVTLIRCERKWNHELAAEVAANTHVIVREASRAMALKDAVEKLSAVSAKLNERSDNLNVVITKLETELRALGPGVTVWLSYVEEDAGWKSCDHLSWLLSPNTCVDDRQQGWGLGYEKIGGSWRIAAEHVEVFVDDDRYDVTALEKPIPLARAPRAVRLGAIGQLENLVRLLTERVEQCLEDVTRVTGGEQ